MLKKILTMLQYKKVLLNSLSVSEVLSEITKKGIGVRYNYSAVCKSASAIVYAFERSSLSVFPAPVYDNMQQTFTLKENNRVEKFKKDVLLKLKLIEFLNPTILKRFQPPFPNVTCEKIPKSLQRICSLDQYSRSKPRAGNRVGPINGLISKNDSFLYDINDKMFISTDRKAIKPMKFKSQATLLPLQRLAVTARAVLEKKDEDITKTFRITKKEAITFSRKTVTFKGLKISLNKV